MQTNQKKIACAAMLCMAMAAPLTSLADEVRVITCGTLNLRAEANTSSAILGKYGWGTQVNVKTIENGWASVDVGGQSGYMYAQYLGSVGSTNYTAYVCTNSRGLNLRDAPNGNILGSYPRGTQVTVLSSDGAWSKVTVNGQTGYMSSQWLSKNKPSGGGSETPSGSTAYVCTNSRGLNLRDAPNGNILGSYPRGTQVTVLSSSNGWSKVTVDGKTGYMSSQWLSAEKPSDGGSETPDGSTAYVCTNSRGLNLRDAPNGNILGSYPRGTQVTVLSSSNGWSKVTVDGKTGYMSSQWLSAEKPSDGGSGTPATGTAVVNNPRDTQVLFLRSQPSTSSEALGYYRNGKVVTLLEKLDGWYKVRVDGQTGYMMAKYLKVTSSISGGTATVYNPNGNSYVNFRSRPSLSASVISTVPVGTTIKVLEKTTDWTMTEINGVIGYISTWFLKF